MPANPTPLAYSIPDAVHATGLPRTTLYELIGRGVLQARKAGRRTLIPADSLNGYLASLPAATIAPPRKAIA